jgi:hypothetical protein
VLDDPWRSYGAQLAIIEVPREALADAIRRIFTAQNASSNASGIYAKPNARRLILRANCSQHPRSRQVSLGQPIHEPADNTRVSQPTGAANYHAITDRLLGRANGAGRDSLVYDPDGSPV